jgi:hypothetical protein
MWAIPTPFAERERKLCERSPPSGYSLRQPPVRLLAGGLLLAVRGHGRAVVGVGLRRRAAPTHRQVLAPPHPQRHALLLCSCWHGMAGMEACMARWHGGMAWIGLWALWWMALLCLGPCLLLVPTLGIPTAVAG